MGGRLFKRMMRSKMGGSYDDNGEYYCNNTT